MSMGERIRTLRKKIGLSQSQLGAKIGAEANTVSRWETDKIEASHNYVVKLANILGTTTDYLLGGKDAPTLSETTQPKNPSSITREALLDCSGRLVIKQGDLYINLPDTPEGYGALRAFLATKGVNNPTSTPQIV